MSFTNNNNQSGNMALSVAMATAGVTLLLSYAGLNDVMQKSKNGAISNQKSHLAASNAAAMSLAVSLFNSGTQTNPAPVHPQVYIPNDLGCENERPLNDAGTSLWAANGGTLKVFNDTKDELSNKNQGQVFDSVQSGQRPRVGSQSTELTVVGFKCSTNPVSPFLIEAVLLQAKTGSAEQAASASQYMVAEVPMTIPPHSQCNMYVRDPRNNAVYPADGNGVGKSVVVSANALALNIDCNYVITDLDVFDNGSRIGGTTTVPTPANSIDAALKAMVAPITLSPANHTLTAIAKQPDGSSVTFDMTVKQIQVLPPSTCAYKCTNDGDIYTRNAWQHVVGYEPNNPWGWGWPVEAETQWICYHPYIVGPAGHQGVKAAFDPAQNCDPPVIVEERGVDFNGCFVGQTQIQMGDGSLKRADAIRPGDMVFSPIIGRAVKVNRVTAGPEVADLINVSVEGRTVQVSQEHPFMTPVGPVAANNLHNGDTILDVDGQYRAISAIRLEKHAEPVVVWNYVLDGGSNDKAHLLVGGGLVSGDLVLQSQPVNRNMLTYAFGLNK